MQESQTCAVPGYSLHCGLHFHVCRIRELGQVFLLRHSAALAPLYFRAVGTHPGQAYHCLGPQASAELPKAR